MPREYPKKRVPWHFRVSEATDVALNEAAVLATNESGSVVPAFEMRQRAANAGTAMLLNCAGCRLGKCKRHVIRGKTAGKPDERMENADHDKRSGARPGYETEPDVVVPVERIPTPKQVVQDKPVPAQLAMIDTAPALIVGDAPKEPKTKRARQYPADFVLTNEMRAYAEQNGIATNRIDGMFEHFSNHHKAKGSKFVDWKLAFYTWVRNYKQYSRGGNVPVQPSAVQGGGKDDLPW
jgi:hypothetical protein